ATEQFRGIDRLGKVSGPELLAGCGVPRVENSGYAECEEPIADDERRCVRTLRHLDCVLVLLEFSLIFLLPQHLAVREIDARHNLFGIAATVHEYLSIGDYGRRIALSNLHTPRLFQRLGPRRRRILA